MEYNRPVKLRDYIFSAVKKTYPIISLPIKCYKVSKYLDKYYLEFELTKNDRELYNSITDINETSISVIFKNSNKWFNKQMPLHVIDNYHQSNIRMRKRRPILKLVVKKLLFNHLSNLTEIQNKYEGNYFILTIEYKGIIFHKQMFINEFEIIKMESHVDKYVFDDIELINNKNQEEKQNQYQNNDIFTLYDDEKDTERDTEQEIEQQSQEVTHIQSEEVTHIQSEENELKKERIQTDKEEVDNITSDTKENIEIIDDIINGIQEKDIKDEDKVIDDKDTEDNNELDKTLTQLVPITNNDNENIDLLLGKNKNKLTKQKMKSKKRIIVYGKNKRKIQRHNL
jgi:hypothetical protein